MTTDYTLTYVIVDDDEDDRLLTKIALARLQRQLPILEFAGGEPLLAYLNGPWPLTNRFHWLILMDIKMQRMTGLETLSRLRAHPQLANVPIVLMTSSADPMLRKDAFALGASNFFIKPITVEEFTRLIEQSFAPWL